MLNKDDRKTGAVRRKAPTHVPVEVARKLLVERDKLAAEVARLRRENARAEDALRAAQVETHSLRERTENAESAANELNDMLSRKTAPDGAVVDQLKSRVASLTNDLNRVRERSGRQIDDARQSERARLMAGLGNVLDSVERALKTADDDNPWRAGLVSIQSQLHAFLRGEGAELTGEIGQAMDPRLHEAVAMVDTPDATKGDIVHVERRGIVLEDGTVARTAQVAVAS